MQPEQFFAKPPRNRAGVLHLRALCLFAAGILLLLLTHSTSEGVDGLEKWMYTDRPANFGRAPEPVFKDSRLGGCFQKRWKPDRKGYYQAVVVQVSCPGKFNTWKPVALNDPSKEFQIKEKPHRSLLENMLLQKPFEIGIQLLKAPWGETRAKREQYPDGPDRGFYDE